MHVSMLATLQPGKGSRDMTHISVLRIQDHWLLVALPSSRAQSNAWESKKIANDMRQEMKLHIFVFPRYLVAQLLGRATLQINEIEWSGKYEMYIYMVVFLKILMCKYFSDYTKW
jgi:hypothetical protein